jgi:hypothetical protein
LVTVDAEKLTMIMHTPTAAQKFASRNAINCIFEHSTASSGATAALNKTERENPRTLSVTILH